MHVSSEHSDVEVIPPSGSVHARQGVRVGAPSELLATPWAAEEGPGQADPGIDTPLLCSTLGHEVRVRARWGEGEDSLDRVFLAHCSCSSAEGLDEVNDLHAMRPEGGVVINSLAPERSA